MRLTTVRAVLGISGGDPSFRDDDGSASPEVVTALAEFEAARCGEHSVLTALASCGLLVPVVAVLTDPLPGQPGENTPLRPPIKGEKASDMAMPTLIGLDGRRAVPAFTSVTSLKLWQADARPVPAQARAVWQAARAESSAVVIDVAGPVPFAVEGARLAALARGEQPPQPAQDPDVHEVVADVLAHQLEIASFALEAADDGHDLVVVLALTAEAAAAGTEQQLAELGGSVVQAIMTRLGTRLRRGVAVYLAAND